MERQSKGQRNHYPFLQGKKDSYLKLENTTSFKKNRWSVTKQLKDNVEQF